MLRYFFLLFLVFNFSISNAQIPIQELNSLPSILFGVDVAVTEDGSILAVIKAKQFTTNTSVLVYQLQNGKYELEQVLEFEFEATDLSFSSDNKTLIVGEGMGNIFRSANVYFFQKIDDEWKKLSESISDPGVPDDATGDSYAVSLDGTTIALGIGAIEDGRVYVYQLNEDGTIEEKGSVLEAEVNEQVFARNIGISGDGNRLTVSCHSPVYTKIFDFEDGEWVEKEIIEDYNGYSALSRDGETALFVNGKQMIIYKRNTNDSWELFGEPIEANTETPSGWNIRDVTFFPESNSISAGMLDAATQETKFATFDKKDDNWIERRNPFYDKTYTDYTGIAISTSADASLLVLPKPRSLNNQGEVHIFNDLEFASLGVAAFRDKNRNGIKDNDEQFFTDCKFIIDDETTLFAQNGYTYASVHGIEHNAVVVPNSEGLRSSTDSIVSISYIDQNDRSILFGLYYENPTITGSIYVVNDQMLCNTTDQNRIIIRNNGSDDFTASITLSFDHIIYESSSLEPQMVTDSSLSWETGVILPGKKLVITTNFDMPNETFTNDLIPMEGTVLLYQEGFSEPAIVKEFDNSFLLRCSYDPNDKAVFPEGLGDDKLTLIDQELVYRVRFQNTGNFPAQHVVVEDEISEHLDLRTLRLIETSHPITQMSQNGRNVKFTFENIMLADSINNEPESHGHIFYAIRLAEDIAENTVIENTADIFFDLNSEVITNTTLSTMVTSFPNGTSTSDLSNSIQFNIYPNPANEEIFIPENLEGGELKIFDVNGKLVADQKKLNPKTNISRLEAAKMYFLIVQKDGLLYSSRFVKR